MSISDKVITAIKHARQTNNVDAFRFDLAQQGINYFIALGNNSLFMFDNSSDCVTWMNSLNSAVSSHLVALRIYYDRKVQAALA